MYSSNVSFKDYVRSNLIIYFALLMGQIFFAGVAFFIVKSGAMGKSEFEVPQILSFLIPLLVAFLIAFSQVFFKRKVVTIKEKTTIESKLIEYRTALIIKFALLEGPSFLSIVFYLVTGDLYMLGLAGLVILVFILNIPTKQRIESDLDLNWQEKSELGE